MIECEWCGAHTRTIKNENGEVVCGRCKRPLYTETDRQKKMKATMQTFQYKDMMKDKIFARTRGWPTLDIDARKDPEISWRKLLNGARYNDPTLYAPRARLIKNQ